MTLSAPSLRLLVEGRLDEAIGRRLARECGFSIEWVLPKSGEGGWAEVKKFTIIHNNQTNVPVLALVDFMDTGESCPPSVVNTWIPHRHPNMVLRAVVREVESWILADRVGLARFLSIPRKSIPLTPEQEVDPKDTVVNLARTSRSIEIKEGLVPGPNSTALVGSGYNPLMEHFVQELWSPAAARAVAPSLDKCMTRLEELRARLGAGSET